MELISTCQLIGSELKGVITTYYLSYILVIYGKIKYMLMWTISAPQLICIGFNVNYFFS